MFSRNKEPEDWTDLRSLEKIILKESGESPKYINDRISLCNYRLLQEYLARKSIDLFFGDGYVEKYPSLGFPEREFKELKAARDRGVRVRMLGRWDPSSPDIIYWANEYVNAEFSEDPKIRKKSGRIEIKSWGNRIRGGIFDGTQAYIIKRQYKVTPNELSRQYLENTTPKMVGRPQLGKKRRKELVPISALLTSLPSLVNGLQNRFNKEFKNAHYMKKDLASLKIPVPTREELGKENILTF